MGWNKYIAVLLLILLPYCLLAGVIKGKVTDEHGVRLPNATIYLEGTTLGVNANGNGDFELTVAPGLYKVICQYIGYKQSSFNISITGNETIEHTFVLKDQSLEIKEVVIHANTEDPAYPIIRNAINRRKFHLDQVHSFQTGIYLKGVARSRKLPDKFMGQKVRDEETVVDSIGKGVLYLTEEDADYYALGDKDKTVIHSVHESGNDGGVGFARFPSVITFYDNNVNVLGRDSRGFISPIAESALSFYKYKYEGQFDEQGHTIYKIRVIPKREYEPCFTGAIYIVDEDWAIHSLNMLLAKQSGMDMFDTLRVDQLFLPLHKDTWVIKSQVLYFTVNMFGFDITATGVTVYNKQKVNEPIPDSIFSGNVISSYDRGANKKDSSYWKDSRPIPLEHDEVRDFVVKDSVKKVTSDPAYVDSVRKVRNKFKPLRLLMSGFSFSSKQYKNTYTVNSILISPGNDNVLNFNIIEGFNVAPRFGIRHRMDTGKYLYGDVAFRYGFSNRHFNAVTRLYYFTRDKEFLNRSWLYGVEGGQYVYQYNPANPTIQFYNTYQALVFRMNDLKLYERRDIAVYAGRNYGDGLKWFVKTSYQQRVPLQNSTNFTIFKGNMDGYTNNLPPHLQQTATVWEKHDAAVIHASVSYKPGIKYIQYPDYKVASGGSKWPLITLTYDKAIPGIVNSVADYDKWRFSIVDEMRLKLLGNLKYNIAAGGFLNDRYVSIPDLMHLYGNRGIGYASPYLQSFQVAQFYEFSNKEKLYGEAHLEYHLKGLLSNKIPFLREARWYLLFGSNTYYANTTNYFT